jgi:ornithine carbamoyltransferase (EC 2.1.3.3)
MSARHFLSLLDFTTDELLGVIRRGIELKDLRKRGVLFEPLKNRVLGMIFEKSSTRTRVSFEAGMIQLGGQAIFLSPRDTQLGRGEPIGDSAIVLSSMLDVVMIRTHAHSTLTEFAAKSRVPVINALSDESHPCQLLADMQTFLEHRGSIQGKTVAWIGDGFNMCNSYIEAASSSTSSCASPARKAMSPIHASWPWVATTCRSSAIRKKQYAVRTW